MTFDPFDPTASVAALSIPATVTFWLKQDFGLDTTAVRDPADLQEYVGLAVFTTSDGVLTYTDRFGISRTLPMKAHITMPGSFKDITSFEGQGDVYVGVFSVYAMQSNLVFA